MQHIAQVHRFRSAVACHVGGGSTTYLTPAEARKLARALNAAARSCEQESFVDSTCGTAEITRADNAPDPRNGGGS